MDLDKLEKERENGHKKGVLFTDFRDDIFVEGRERFDELNIGKDKLKHWQDKYPFLYPWNSAYEIYRINVNRQFVVYPLIIAMCENDKHVLKAFKISRKYNLPISIRGGSHCMEDFSLTTGILIDQSRRKNIKIKDEKATVEGGVLFGPLIYELQKRNYCLPTGTCANVGVYGATLGGGLGYLIRKYGLTCDSLIKAKILLANGKIVKVDKNEHKDLFWALKGAGNANFGIVTEMTFTLYPVQKVVLFDFKYDIEKLVDLLEYWQEWGLNLQENNWGCQFRFKNGGNMPIVEGIYLGKKKDARKVLDKFFQLKPKEIIFEKVDYYKSAEHFTGKARWLPFTKSKNGYVYKPWPRKAFEIVYYYMKRGSGESVFELELITGKINDVKRTDTAYVHRGAIYWLLLNAHWDNYETGEKELKWLNSFYQALLPYISDESYSNMPDIYLPKALQQYYGENLPRLVEIKNKYDPDNVFNFKQSIPLSL